MRGVVAPVRTGIVLDRRVRIRTAPDGHKFVEFRIPISGRQRHHRHDLVMLSCDGKVIVPPRAWTPKRRAGAFRWSTDLCSCQTGGVHCSACGRKARLDPRRRGVDNCG